MDSIGDMLRRARNDRGFTLDDVAARTRISRKHLEAIEKGDRSAIPGGFFYKSFVRQYAAALAAQDSDLISDIEELLAKEQGAISHAEPERHLPRKLSLPPIEEKITGPRPASASASVYGVFLLFALIGSTGLYIWWRHAQQAAATTSAHVAAAAKQPPARAEVPATVAPASTAVEAPAATTTQRTENSMPAPHVEGKIVLEITAIDVTWCSVTADGKSVFGGTLQPGESKTFAAEENARMRIGNAGGLEVKYNGKPTGPLGPKGQVRTVLFTPTSFEIMKPLEDEG